MTDRKGISTHPSTPAQPQRILWPGACLLLLVAIGAWPALAGFLAQLVFAVLGLLLSGVVALLSQPELLLVAVLVCAIVQVRRFLRRLA